MNTDRGNDFIDVFSETADEASISFVDRTLAELADEHSDVVVLSADLANSLGTFRKRHPERYFELGIAETNAISVAAGLAAVGMRPYILAFAPFGMIKCAEQIRTDLAITEMPVTIVTRLSGLAMGYFGGSHHAIEDIAIARAINNFTVYSPADGLSTQALIERSYDDPRPKLIRVSEGTKQVYNEVPEFEDGAPVMLREGSEIALLATGLGVNWALDAARSLEGEGISVAVYDVPFLAPVNEETFSQILSQYPGVVTIEEHIRVGGLFSLIAELVVTFGSATKVKSVAIPDEHLEVGTHPELLEHYGLSAEGVKNAVADLRAVLGN